MRPMVLALAVLVPLTAVLAPAGAVERPPVFLHGAGAADAAPEVAYFRTGLSLGEPTIAVLASGAIVVQGAYFADVGAPAHSRVVRSSDGGHTWRDVTPQLFGANRHVDTLDPYLYADPATNRLFSQDLVLPCAELSWSDDEGATWAATTIMGCTVTDHQTLFAGPPVTSRTTGYPNVLYYCAMQAGASVAANTVSCEKSLDGGFTFGPTGLPLWTRLTTGGLLGSIDCYPAHGHGHVGPDGALYLPSGWCGVPQLAISRDEGATWDIVQVADNGMPGHMEIGPLQLPGHDAAVAATADGTLYYFYIASDWLPYLAVSRDGGSTWEAPRVVAPAEVKAAALPQMTMGADGKLAWVYLATFDDRAASDAAWHGALGVTPDGGETIVTGIVNPLSDPLAVGACGPIVCQSTHDFMDVAIGPDGAAWGVWTDSCVDAACDGSAAVGDEGVVATLVGAPSLR